MKKYLWIGILSILALLLITGCGGQEEAVAEAAGSGGLDYESEYLDTDYENAMPVMTQLTLGTLMLEDSEHPITPEQAVELIPLWQALRSLQESGTSSQAEYKAVLGQIEENMTTEQMKAIAAMEIQREDLMTAMQQAGIEFQPPEGVGGSGGMPDGAPPGGMPGGGGQIANQIPEDGSADFGSPAALYDALIEMLEKIAES